MPSPRYSFMQRFFVSKNRGRVASGLAWFVVFLEGAHAEPH